MQGTSIISQAAEPFFLGIEIELAVRVGYHAKEHRVIRKDRLHKEILLEDLTVELLIGRICKKKTRGRDDRYMKKETGGIFMKAIDTDKYNKPGNIYFLGTEQM